MLRPPTNAWPGHEPPSALPLLPGAWNSFLTSSSSRKTWRAKASGLSVPDLPGALPVASDTGQASPHTPSPVSLVPLPGGMWVARF